MTRKSAEEGGQESKKEVEVENRADWLSKWEFVGRKKQPANKGRTGKREGSETKPGGLETRNRFEVLAEEVTERDENRDSSNRETVMIGSSMVGGVGKALQRQLLGRFEWRKHSGARIEHITRKVQEFELGSDVKNLVLMVGTNNLKSDGTTAILQKYGELISTAKEKGEMNITVVGILSRNDVGEFYESKRYGINCRLKKKCEEMGVKYFEMGGSYRDRKSVLCVDGLHLNDVGADKLGREIYNHLFLQVGPGGGVD
jgi:lysophospholipase L1-like esterase